MGATAAGHGGCFGQTWRLWFLLGGRLFLDVTTSPHGFKSLLSGFHLRVNDTKLCLDAAREKI